jgi:hypothetical protein
MEGVHLLPRAHHHVIHFSGHGGGGRIGSRFSPILRMDGGWQDGDGAGEDGDGEQLA